jgi:hypothetical protein
MLLVGTALLLLMGCAVADISDIGTTPSNTPSSAPSSVASTQPPTLTSTGLIVPESVAEAMAANATPFTLRQPGMNVIDVNLADAADLVHGVHDDGTVVTITQPGDYRLYGSLQGQVVVSCKDGLFNLILDGVTIISDTPGALLVTSGDEVVLHLADNSSNSIQDGLGDAPLDADAPNAAIHSVANLGITGTGALNVTGAIDGIASTDGLLIADGQLKVSAGDDALRGKDYLVVAGGTLTLDAAGDAMKSTHDSDATRGYVWISGSQIIAQAGTDCVDAMSDVLVSGGQATLACGDDGLHGEVLVLVDDGVLNITRSYEGLEAPVVVVAGGVINIVSSDDALNAAGGDGSDAPDVPGVGAPANRPGGSGRPGGTGGGPGGSSEDPTKYMLLISGGTLTVDAGGDGLDSNGYMTISGGDTTVYGPTNQGNGALDSSGLTLTGGKLFAVGESGMAEGPTQATQAWIGVIFDAAAASTITITDTTDAALTWSFTIPKSSQCLVFSNPQLLSGRSYSITVNAALIGEVTAF